MERSPADILKLGDIDPELAAYVEKNGWPKLPDGDIPTRRQMQKQMLVSTRQAAPHDVHEEEIPVPARDGYAIPVSVYKPTSGVQGPLVVLFHAGGYLIGSPLMEDQRCRQLVQKFGCVCLNVDYRLAPENKFPIPVNDGYDVVKWGAANAQKLGADPSKGFIVYGRSAGGEIADIIGHLARDEGISPPLTGIIGIVPMILAPDIVPIRFKGEYLSQEQNKDAPPFTSEVWSQIEEAYEPDHSSPLYSSFNNPNGHAGLPPFYFQVAGRDLVRDDSLIYEKLLRTEAGVRTRIDVYPGVPHSFDTMVPTLEISKQASADFLRGVEWVLEQGCK